MVLDDTIIPDKEIKIRGHIVEINSVLEVKNFLISSVIKNVVKKIYDLCFLYIFIMVDVVLVVYMYIKI